MEREATARSARTRRSSRSSLGWTTGNVVQGFRSGLDGNECAECRVDSVKHSTSPSHRENARRAITSPVFSKPVCCHRTSACPTAAPPRISVCRLQHVHDLRVPNRCIAGQHLVPLSYSPCPERERHAGKFRHRTAALILLRATNSASLGKRR